MKIANLKIGVRLGLAFAALLLLLAGVAYVGWASLAATKARVDIITKENNVKMALAHRLRTNLNVVARGVRNYILYADQDARQKELGLMAEARKVFYPTSNS
jgi:methyl-accepting chemotaxis protein